MKHLQPALAAVNELVQLTLVVLVLSVHAVQRFLSLVHTDQARVAHLHF